MAEVFMYDIVSQSVLSSQVGKSARPVLLSLSGLLRCRIRHGSRPVIRSANLFGTLFAGLFSKAKYRPKGGRLKNVDMPVEGNILTIRVDLSRS